MTDAQLYAHAKTVIPGGTGLLSKRPEMFAPEVFPAYFKAAEKCRITTVDGRELIDFGLCGIAACLLGYNDEDVTQAVIKTIADGNFSTLNPPEEVELADTSPFFSGRRSKKSSAPQNQFLQRRKNSEALARQAGNQNRHRIESEPSEGGADSVPSFLFYEPFSKACHIEFHKQPLWLAYHLMKPAKNSTCVKRRICFRTGAVGDPDQHGWSRAMP